MAKFKKGDRVVSTSGNRGVVDEVYDHEQYAVRFDGRSMPDRVEGFKLRAANSANVIEREKFYHIEHDGDVERKRRLLEEDGYKILSVDYDHKARTVEFKMQKDKNRPLMRGDRVKIMKATYHTPAGTITTVDHVDPYDEDRVYVKWKDTTLPLKTKDVTRCNSTNPVVANALAWKMGGEVAKNADDGTRVRVVAETETLFGKRREEKTMTVGELRAAMTRIGHGRLFADVVRDAETGKDANPLLKLPCEAWIRLA